MTFEFRHPKYYAELRKQRKELKDHTCKRCGKKVNEQDYSRYHGSKCKDGLDA